MARLVALATPAAAVFTPAAATTTAVSSPAAATATTAAFLAGPGFVHRQAASVHFLQIHRLNSGRRLAAVRHFDEAKALAAPGVTVLYDLRAFDSPVFSEELFQALTGNAVTQIADIKPCSHKNIP